MHSKLLLLAAAVTSVTAQCPDVWNTISAELTNRFLENGECNRAARQTIRMAFHDCGAWNLGEGETGGCDGSMALVELDRIENQVMADTANGLVSLANEHGVSVADMIAFGAAHAIATCPGGPRPQTFVGRQDSRTPSPAGLLPPPDASGEEVNQLMREKGFNVEETVALIGAHTVSRQTFNQQRANAPQDTTPGRWDAVFYSQTLQPPGEVFVIPADLNVAQAPESSPAWNGFASGSRNFNGVFSAAFTKMTLLGVPGGSSNLIDCTGALPGGTARRDMKSAPINYRS